MNTQLEQISRFVRPCRKVPATFFADNQRYMISMTDDIIWQNLPEDFFRHGCEDGEGSYLHIKAGEEGTDDSQVAQAGPLIFSSIKSILATVDYLIELDLKNEGPLKAVAAQKQENLNVGYFSANDDETYVVFLERKPREEGEQTEYHLHASLSPRKYKSHRNMLLAETGELKTDFVSKKNEITA